jgi:hypothetical protein
MERRSSQQQARHGRTVSIRGGHGGVFLGHERGSLDILAGGGIERAPADQFEPAAGFGAEIRHRRRSIGDARCRVALGDGEQFPRQLFHRIGVIRGGGGNLRIRYPC